MKCIKRMKLETKKTLLIIIIALTCGSLIYSQTRIRPDQIKPEPVKLGTGTVGQITQIQLDGNGKRELTGIDLPTQEPKIARKYGIDLSSQVNGMNVSFSTPEPWELGSEVVLFNGIRQLRGTDYSVVPNGSGNGTIVTFAFHVPGTTSDGSSDTVVMDYQPIAGP